MDELEEKERRYWEKQLVILKTTVFIMLPVTGIFVLLKEQIINFIHKYLNLNLTYHELALIYLIIAVIIFKVVLHKHAKKYAANKI
jgi:hypothetical protein